MWELKKTSARGDVAPSSPAWRKKRYVDLKRVAETWSMVAAELVCFVITDVLAVPYYQYRMHVWPTEL